MQIRLARADELRTVLYACLATPGAGPAEVELAVQTALSQTRLIPGQSLWPWVVYDGPRLAGGCLSVESPCGSVLLAIPHDLPARLGDGGGVTLLAHVRDFHRNRGGRWLQGLVDTRSSASLGEVLRAAGFQYVARLSYMEADPRAAPARRGLDGTWRWSTYSEESATEFVAALAASYEDTQDCPELSQWRTPSEALACHRASGVFRAARWLLARAEQGAAGCILLNEVPLRSALEVAYMGVCPRARRCGLGHALLARAEWMARREGFSTLCLVVDERNVAARRLYEQHGFRASSARDAWIAVLFEPA